MKHGQKQAVLTLLDREMLQRGSWCGETHIQKATFLLQDLMGVDLGFDFVLYRHGPFSFELRDELSLMQANDLVSLQLRQPGYGPSLVPSEFSESFLERFPKTTARYIPQIRFVAEELSGMNVTELERVATAFFITKHGNGESVSERAEGLVSLKPHIPVQNARQACEHIDALIQRASPLRLTSDRTSSQSE
jgi:hypothetical protein